jgi:5'-AMP-activated protein kinase regulatory beta subunit
MGNQQINGSSHHATSDDPRSHHGGSVHTAGGYQTGAGPFGQQQPIQSHGQFASPSVASSTGYGQYSKGDDQQDPMRRSLSDASMTLLDDVNSGTNQGIGQLQQPPGVENWLDDDTVPTVFRWEHGGRQVYITGTFNGWSRQIPMHRSGNDFTYIHNLKRGKHAFKFIVDDEWRFAPDQPTVADIEGRINNFIDVTDFKAYTGDKEFEKEKAAAENGCYNDPDDVVADETTDSKLSEAGKDRSSSSRRPDKDGEVYGHVMPDLDDYTKEPPPLPPHLRHIILNKPPQLQDTAALPVPQHVALNHLYCTAIKDNMMVLGITQRFKTKFVTTVYYSPCSTSK